MAIDYGEIESVHLWCEGCEKEVDARYFDKPKSKLCNACLNEMDDYRREIDERYGGEGGSE